MQCPSVQDARTDLFNAAENIQDGTGALFLHGDYDISAVLFRKRIIYFSEELMVRTWSIISKYIHDMYMQSLKLREGIG